MDYYELLGVTSGASDSEIRRAYRQLAKQYHPDKNPSAEAAQRMAEINDAYDVLSDPEKRTAYDRRFTSTFSYEEPVVQEDPRDIYRREYMRRKKDEEQRLRERYWNIERKVYIYLRFLSMPVLVFAILLLIDGFLPPTVYHEIAVSGRYIPNASYLTTEHITFGVPNLFYYRYHYDNHPEPLTISVTPIFKTLLSVSLNTEGDSRTYFAHNTIQSPGFSWPFVLLLFSGFTVVMKRYSKVNSMVAYMVPVIVLVVMLILSGYDTI